MNVSGVILTWGKYRCIADARDQRTDVRDRWNNRRIHVCGNVQLIPIVMAVKVCVLRSLVRPANPSILDFGVAIGCVVDQFQLGTIAQIYFATANAKPKFISNHERSLGLWKKVRTSKPKKKEEKNRTENFQQINVTKKLKIQTKILITRQDKKNFK